MIVFVQAVENPSCAEIRDVLTAAGLNVLMEVWVLFYADVLLSTL